MVKNKTDEWKKFKLWKTKTNQNTELKDTKCHERIKEHQCGFITTSSHFHIVA